MHNTPIPIIVIDDTPVKRRGICDFVEETPQLRLHAQAGDAASSIRLIESISEQQRLRRLFQNGGKLNAWLRRVSPGAHRTAQ